MSLTRRTFLSSTAASVAAAAALRPSSASAQVQGANERVRVGVIGTGRQGQTVMRGHLALPDVEIVALCDVYEPNLQLGAKLAPEAKQVKDFRAILDDKTIDAVIVATPDHWHALQTVMACQAGKDVYVEKPTSVAIAEGRKMVQAARTYNRVVQVGTQQRSGAHFQQAAKLIQDGVIGRISAVRWTSPRASNMGATRSKTASASCSFPCRASTMPAVRLARASSALRPSAFASVSARAATRAARASFPAVARA